MDYKRIYDQIIEFRQINSIKEEIYKELHHVVPRSCGGSNKKENLVYLTAREHFICHYLLTKIYKEESYQWYKMNHAFILMKANGNNHDRYFNSRLYESKRKNFSKVMSKTQSGSKNSQHGTMWIHNSELKESKKILKIDEIPDGWEKGRVLNWNKPKNYNKPKKCIICSKEFIPSGKNVKACSKECSEHLKHNNKIKHFEIHSKKYNKLFYDFLMSDYPSINKFAHSIGFDHKTICSVFSKYVKNYKKHVFKRQQKFPKDKFDPLDYIN